MATIDPLTGARVPQQSDGPLGGLQIANAVNDLAPRVLGGPFATVSARDAAYQEWAMAGGAMRDGLECWVTGVGHQVYLTAGGWVTVFDGTQAAKRTRQWTLQRTSPNASEDFSAGSMTSLISGSLGSMTAGDYLLTVALSLSSSAGASAGYLRLLANSTNVSEDIRSDLNTDVRAVNFTVGYQHTGGTLSLDAQFQSASRTGTVWTNGSRITIAFLGQR